MALRRMRRSPTRSGWKPRIVVRAPYPGDVHPLDRRWIASYLERVPVEFIVGLKSVELLARKNPVGFPYGDYMSDERRIRLYSLPPSGWRMGAQYSGTISQCKSLGARVENLGDEVELTWPDRTSLEIFMVDTFLHELGHHYVYMHRTRRKLPSTVIGHEHLAEQWRVRLWRAFSRGPAGSAPGSLNALYDEYQKRMNANRPTED